MIKLRNEALPGPEFDNKDDNLFNTPMDYGYFGATLPNMGPVLHAMNYWRTNQVIMERELLENSEALLQQVGLSQAAAASNDADDFNEIESLVSDCPLHQRSVPSSPTIFTGHD